MHLLLRALMKLCMISGYANYFGGVENVVNELNKYMTKRHVGVTVFTQSNRDFVETRNNLRNVEVRPYYMPQSLQVAYYDKIAYNFKVCKKIQRFGPFDIVHGHSDNCLFYSIFRNEVPFILTVHGTKAKAVTP
jgi:glycosyltransferase involved in cell wall biosynthesis